MELQTLIALLTFAFASTVSPGPNNIMLMTSGANVGFIRTIPHMLGITLGFSFMVILVGVGLMQVFAKWPLLQQILQVLCIAYLVYLALKIALSKPSRHSCAYRPMSFLAAANFQWINPKAWSMALTAVSVYNINGTWQGVLVVSLCFALVNIPSVSIWAYAGQKLQRWLSCDRRLRGFNLVMAALLLLSLLMMF
ncbi:LysE family translocator [Shewanella waksmanii]|uniref:LysE family translocator n=1 Tax=Shewanella waksmanii TaxID=213783 RepID=UPI003736A1E1